MKRLAAVVLLLVAGGSARADHTLCAETEALFCGQTRSRSLLTLDETDCFTFEGVAGDVVSITTGSVDPLLVPCWDLFAPDGARVGDFRSCTQEERTLPTSGTYRIAVFEQLHVRTGAYTLSLETVSDSPASCAEPLTCGQSRAEELELPGSTDSFRFAGRLGETVAITAVGRDRDFIPCWTLFSPSGTRIGESASCDRGERTLPVDGDYTVVVFENDARDTGLYAVTVDVPSAPCGGGATRSYELRLTLRQPPPIGAEPDELGAAVAIGGAALFVGAPHDASGAADAGAVHVIDSDTGSPNGSTQHTLLAPIPAAGDRFGAAVAALADRVLVGAPGTDGVVGPDAGAAFVHDEDGALVRSLSPPSLVARARFGSAVAARGADPLVGAPGDGAEGGGRAYLFDGASGGALTTFVPPTPAAGDEFGASLAAATEVLIGAPNVLDQGRAFVFAAQGGGLLGTLVSPTAATGDEFGLAVAATSAFFVVGAPGAGDDAGRVFVFDAGTGALVRSLEKPSAQAGDRFGTSLAALGNVLIVGAALDGRTAVGGGAAYVFDLGSGALVRVLEKPGPRRNDLFGSAVAAAGGNRFLVGAPLDDAGTVDGGAAYLFATETLEAVLRKRPAESAFGTALLATEDALVVGAPLANDGAGAVFRFDPTTGTEQEASAAGQPGERLGSALADVGDDVAIGAPRAAGGGRVVIGPLAVAVPDGAAGDQFGFALTSSGPELLVGAPLTGEQDPGAAYLVDAASRTIVQRLRKPTPVAGDFFGAAVALRGDDLLLGAPFDGEAAPRAGAAYLFRKSTGAFVRIFTSPTAAGEEQLGAAVAITPAGYAVGAPLADVNGVADAGRVYVFDGEGNVVADLPNPDEGHGDQFGAALASVEGQLLVGAPLDDSGAPDAGSVYVFETSTWGLVQTLRDPVQIELDRFGVALAPVGDGVFIGAPGAATAYLFTATEDAAPTASARGLRTLADGGRCGNGVVEPGEECDDANDIDTDACRSDCRRVPCCIIEPLVDRRCDDHNPCTTDHFEVDGCRHDEIPGCSCRPCNGCFLFPWACCSEGPQCGPPESCGGEQGCVELMACRCAERPTCGDISIPESATAPFVEACDRVRRIESLSRFPAPGASVEALAKEARSNLNPNRLKKPIRAALATIVGIDAATRKRCKKSLLRFAKDVRRAVPRRKALRCVEQQAPTRSAAGQRLFHGSAGSRVDGEPPGEGAGE